MLLDHVSYHMYMVVLDQCGGRKWGFQKTGCAAVRRLGMGAWVTTKGPSTYYITKNTIFFNTPLSM